MRRGMVAAVLGAVVVGSAGGGLAALHLAARAARTSAPAPVQLASVAPAPRTPAAITPAPPDPHAALAARMADLLARFAAWSRDHAGAPCPDPTRLGGRAVDPWGNDLALTCTDQPADQRIGVVSAGSDGIAGTEDDVTSWSLGASVTGVVRGPRWTARTAAESRLPKPASGKRRKLTPEAEHARTGRGPVRSSPEAAHVPASRPAAPAVPLASPGTAEPARAPAGPIDAGGDDIPARR